MIVRLIASNAAAIAITSLFIGGFNITGDPYITIAIGAVALGVAQYTIKPLLKLISFPINVITLGVFNVVINAAVLWIVLKFVEEIEVTEGTIYLSLPFLGEVIPETNAGFLTTLFAASISISIINWIIRKLFF